ncbi:hypothetical protein N431DRAFT_505193 [Stipitochalara longipes BDJ]|nr:hypothetical protein N431DRAFT_505193 [Stipitochalara longipes BDJ]
MDSWDYEECLDLIDYMPQRNAFLDVWQYEGITKQNVQEGDLACENLDEYLSRSPCKDPDRQLAGGLRMIYSCIDTQLDCSDKTVFWTRSDFVKIMNSFRLPRRFTQMMARCHCIFAQSPSDAINSEGEQFSYIFSTIFHHSPFWSLAAFWDSTTNITYAFLHSTSDPEEDSILRLKRFLTKSAPQSLHPLLLPLLIMDLETNLTLRDEEKYDSEINTIEEHIRQTPSIAANTVDQIDINRPLIVQQLNGCSVFLPLIERESEAVLLHLEQLHSMISELHLKNPKLALLSKRLLMHVDFLANSRKNLFLRLQSLQRRSQTQLAFLNIAVARDSKVSALASSCDSRATKNVAILTIAFLFANFSFAIHPFNWQANSSRAIIGSHYWVSWGLTVPLTRSVLGAWVVWIRFDLKVYGRSTARYGKQFSKV